VKLKLNKYVSKDWIVGPWYRYYIQSQAFFAARPAADEFHSGDYKLSAFESNTMGVDATWFLRSLGRTRRALEFLSGSSLSVMYFHYFNNTPGTFSCDVLQTKVNFSY
jgi:hypothetical protein